MRGESTFYVITRELLGDLGVTDFNEVLRLTSGNKSRAARILGISRQGLIEKLRRLRIEEVAEGATGERAASER